MATPLFDNPAFITVQMTNVDVNNEDIRVLIAIPQILSPNYSTKSIDGKTMTLYFYLAIEMLHVWSYVALLSYIDEHNSQQDEYNHTQKLSWNKLFNNFHQFFRE